jgi:hypothetical protein
VQASAVIADVCALLKGEPVFLAGSLVAEQAYGKANSHADVDLFCPTSQVLIATGQRLLDNGYKFDDRFDRVWVRWLKYGFKSWHTNSLRLHSPNGMETNLVYKLTDGHPTTSLAQVLESFDFGLLAMGYDLESNTYRDMRSYLFPGMDPMGPLPLMPNKREAWRNGFISQYNGLRECGRYAKYHGYGYDLSLVKDDLITGYDMASMYFSTHFDKDKQLLGSIYDVIARHLEADNIDELVEAYKQIDFNDSLDSIMEALE